jgi:hypothetical protein
MKAASLVLTALFSIMVSCVAQKVDSETGNRSRIVHLRTALNHLTVIEMSEPVVEVASGSPAFRVEWRENKVFVQPTEADAATNLFIWTASRRLNYELEPANSVSNMDFAVDEAPVAPAKATVTPSQPPASRAIPALLFGAQPVRIQPKQVNHDERIEIWISDLWERDGQLSLRYVARNYSNQSYKIAAPLAFQLDGARLPQSLYGLVNSQLSHEQVSKLRIRQQMPLEVVDAQVQSEDIAPGEQLIGLVTLQITSSANPTILRLQFPNVLESKHPQEVAAYLVR